MAGYANGPSISVHDWEIGHSKGGMAMQASHKMRPLRKELLGTTR